MPYTTTTRNDNNITLVYYNSFVQISYFVCVAGGYIPTLVYHVGKVVLVCGQHYRPNSYNHPVFIHTSTTTSDQG